MKETPPTQTNSGSIPFSTSEEAGVQLPSQPSPATVPTVGQTSGINTSTDNSQLNPSSIVTIEGRKSDGFSGKIFPVLILVMIGIWAWVGYIFFQNKQLDIGKTGKLNNPASEITNTPSPEQILYDPETVRISQGNIIIDSADGGSKVIINKADYKNSGIIGFTKVGLATDLKRICFESIPPATIPELYISDIEGSNVIKVGNNLKNCTWAKDSKTLFYVEYLNGNARTDIYKYNVESKEATNLTEFTQTDKLRTYNLLGLSADGSSLICTYTESGVEATKNCEINTETNVLDDL